MFELLILVSLKSHAIVGAVALVVGGYLGFRYGAKVEKDASAALSKAGGAITGASGKV